MSADKYPCIFSRQMETIVYIFYKNIEAEICEILRILNKPEAEILKRI